MGNIWNENWMLVFISTTWSLFNDRVREQQCLKHFRKKAACRRVQDCYLDIKRKVL